jgi:hypothetical protein
MAHLNFDVQKLKDVRGRRITGYRASFADLYADASTPQDAAAKLKDLVQARATCDRHEDRSIVFGEYCAHIWRGFYGIDSRLFYPDGHVSSNSHTGDIEKAERDVRSHIAQLCYPASNASDVIKAIGTQVEYDADMRDFTSWCEFQDRYKVATARGMSSNDAHSFALRNPARSELWKEEETVRVA